MARFVTLDLAARAVTESERKDSNASGRSLESAPS